ncbi:MAG TPA: hypothetical protein VFT55_02040 [Planctomycetota bacterium]|nr:hypothetical protein [Planctomycetota bacterium]
MSVTPAAAVAAFSRRVAATSFLAGAMQAVLVVAVVAALLQLALRCLGSHLAPQPIWAVLLVPVLAAGWWRLRRERLDATVVAGHLDRRLGLQGLLLCAREGQALEPVWSAHLHERLQALPAVLPRPRWKKLVVLPGLALSLATAITLLPAPPLPPEPPQLQARTAELDRIAEQLRDLFARGDLPVETRREIEQKVQELRQKVEAGEVPEWRDLDQLEQQLERAELLAAASREGNDGGGSGSEQGGGEAQHPTPAALAKTAAALAAAGVLAEMPAPFAAGLLAAQAADGSFDPKALPQDAEGLRALAEAMAAAAGQSLGELAQRLPPEQLADLRALVEGHGQQPGEGEGEGVGRGGVDRGPGHSALDMTEDAQGGADAALALPPGLALPGDWVPVGDRRTEPVVQPVTNASPGAAGAGGLGGASWQLQLAPRHRAVVQRFFDQTAATGRGK